MGITIEQALELRAWIARYTMSGPLLTLGVQDLGFSAPHFRDLTGLDVNGCDGPMTDRAFFAICGLHDVHSMDVSAYEGANVVFDLNSSPQELPEALVGKYGVLLNGGTLEHVFHVPNALSSLTRLLRPGGVVVHIVPTHNWVDHGFYQFSPTLLFDYYGAAKFQTLEAVSFSAPKNAPSGQVRVAPVQPGSFGDGLSGALDDETLLVMFAAQKTAESLEAVTPVQRIYAPQDKIPRVTPRWFPPYVSQNGKVMPTAPPERATIADIAPAGGVAWSAPLSARWAATSDGVDRPLASQLVLLEDGALLGPPHALHDAIRRHGGGRYSHWGSDLIFSTSDNSDPRTNGRHYEIWAPLLSPP